MTLVSYAAVGMIMCSLFFMLAVAPFHSWFVGIVSVAILPVCGFITLVPPFAYLACLINSMVNIFWTAGEFIKPALLIFASISLFIGALSANGEKNLRELFAFSSIYHIGFLLFTIVSFNDNSVLSAFAYMMVYILAMAGVYTVFLGLKSRGDYLTGLSDIDGLSVSKPYLSAALLVFMVSLAGIPPMLGFWEDFLSSTIWWWKNAGETWLFCWCRCCLWQMPTFRLFEPLTLSRLKSRLTVPIRRFISACLSIWCW